MSAAIAEQALEPDSGAQSEARVGMCRVAAIDAFHSSHFHDAERNAATTWPLLSEGDRPYHRGANGNGGSSNEGRRHHHPPSATAQ
jgi:L-ascorbate metabolism protein UlaG (beta-lactamase superfamily)